MGYYFTPERTSELAPCEDCLHTDCAELRAKLEAPCPLCNESIGYGSRVYYLRDGSTVHAQCEEQQA